VKTRTGKIEEQIMSLFPNSQDKLSSDEIEIPQEASADQIALWTDIRALQQRLKRVNTWSEGEICVFLRGATQTLRQTKNLEVARNLFNKGYELFLKDTQSRNRNWYVLALLPGILAVTAITGLVGHLAAIEFGNLAPKGTIISLFTFAALGSVTSVLTRLSSLDLSQELSRKFVVYSAVSKPLVAISFASVVYLILTHKLVPIQLGNGDQASQEATVWVAAFLCGFTERFASDLLERIVPGKDKSGGADRGEPSGNGMTHNDRLQADPREDAGR
jgi:hypothetical protein